MSPRTAQQNEQIKDETREKILSGALRVFSHRGFAATRISDIAKACAISHGLLYYYFSSKDDIFLELVQRAVASSSQALLAAEALPYPPLQKIAWITAEILQHLVQDSDSAYYFLIMTQSSLTDTLLPEIQTQITQANIPFEVMMRMVSQGQADGSIVPGDPFPLVTAYWAAIQGIAVYRIAFGDAFPTPTADILLRLFKTA